MGVGALVLLMGFFVVPQAFAQTDNLASVAETANLGNNDLIATIGLVINVVLGLLGIIFLLLMIYAGFLWMTAGGDEKRVEQAKHTIIRAVIGIVIILMSYAIASFVVKLLSDATGSGRGGSGSGGGVTIPSLSGSLGAGPVRDHYPDRDRTNIARNTNISVTFRDQMEIASLIQGYDDAGTPLDVSDDVVATKVNTDNVKIYRSIDGVGAALADVDVYFTPDFRTFVFNPVEYLGSPTEDVSYTVLLEDKIKNATGNKVFVGNFSGGYEWTFETGVNLDLDPPKVTSVVPLAGGAYAKNIVVQVTFDEPMDPTAASGVRLDGSGFSNLQVVGSSATPVPGTYLISNGYKTVTFQTSLACGTNSCGETIYCLPGSQPITTTVKAASLSSAPPQANAFPYDGVVDMATNSLDGNGDGVAGDNYAWSFSTTNDINLQGSTVESVTPNLLEEDVALDQDVVMVFSDILMSSTVNADNIVLTNQELSSGASHEQWFRFDVDGLTSANEQVTSSSMLTAKSRVTMPHGVLLESVDGKTYMYGVNISQGVLNQYQNCYLPAKGPDATGGTCAVTAGQPYCCNGVAQATACTLF